MHENKLIKVFNISLRKPTIPG